MNTLSNERLEQLASGDAWACVQDDEGAAMARELLALRKEREAAVPVPVAWLIEGGKSGAPPHFSSEEEYAHQYPDRKVTPLYATPPAQPVAVPDAVDYSDLDAASQDREVIEAIAECKGWNACRAAMLKEAK